MEKGMRLMRWICVTGWMVTLTVLFSIEGLAHKPISIGGFFDHHETALQLEEVDVSQVVYSKFSADHSELWLRFDSDQAIDLYVSLGIPVLDRLTTYRPGLAVLGLDMPAVDLPAAVPEGYGGVVFQPSSSEEPLFFHEPFTGTDSWILLEESVSLPGPGRYYIVVWPPKGIYDKVWVAVGVKEKFGLKDFLSLPIIVRDVRAFHEIGPRFGGESLFKILFLGTAALVIACLAMRFSR